MNDWNVRLLQTAAECSAAPGAFGNLLRAQLASLEHRELIRDLSLAHARARNAVVIGVRASIRSGALLLQVKQSMPADEFAKLLRIASMQPQAADNYMQLALNSPELSQRCLRRRSVITESESMNLLSGRQTVDPVTDLRALHELGMHE